MNQRSVFFLIAVTLAVLIGVVAGIIASATVPAPANPADPLCVQEARQAALKRAGAVFLATVTLELVALGMLMDVLS
ncbi:hypothetical protein Kpho02_68140 [Kitasatospora phosalacinea]|uniref:Uncharacterized protein n=1 Tax=Kitasatospora phosalacinea TaxID=2065 RepID=A0A9W6QFA8_9ACTN|nr:hypothetical protein [Kitasatospora phosalacinea]GLW74516.1 hypothetical protein Kpho02_68140 [Kitasatospora phosalacinea]